MKAGNSQPSKPDLVVKIIFRLIVASIFICAAAYLSTIILRCKDLYGQHVRWSGSAYRADPVYGYFPSTGAVAFHTLKDGERIPVVFDRLGFRVPDVGVIANQQLNNDRKILFIGGSFTHGYGVRAEDTFAYKAADQLNATAFNGGGSGWGLSQMLLRARDVVPMLRPDIVVVEYSMRLARRSMRLYGPTNWAKSPAPYFYDSAGQIDIHRPVFESMNFALPIWEPDKPGFLPYLLRVGIPLYVHDDFMTSVVAFRQRIGDIPPPAVAKDQVEAYAYNAIHEICKEFGSTMVILSIPEHFNDRPRHTLNDAVAVPIVETLEPLKARLTGSTKKEWNLNYRLMNRDGSRLLDKHPSARMHTAIADILVGAIRETLPVRQPVP